MTRKGPEALLQSLVMDYLAATHVLCFRMNSGQHVAEHNGRKRVIRYGVKGMADLLAFPGGRPTWLEIKAGTTQSPEQKSFQQLVESHGQRYFVCRSLEDVIAALA